MAEEVLLVLTTWPDATSARLASRKLVEEKLAACANILPGIESIYRWKEKIESSAEVLVVMKTTIGRYPQLELRIREIHTYETPEVLCFRAADGFSAYLRWIEKSCAD